MPEFKKVPGCQHLTFAASVEVARVSESEGGPITHFCAHIRIRCEDCGEEFSFEGLPRGFNISEPMAGAFGLEARLPIKPLSCVDKSSESLKFVVPTEFPNGETNA